jgi:eukaryotic-like serine/threonine-protein kinase
MSEATPKRQIGPFELHEKLGVGGMGIVYRAKYLKNGAFVAVKVLSPDLMADEKIAVRFGREMQILKKLQHPHIVKYYGGSTSGVTKYYAMEMVKGGSLEQMLKKRGPLDWELAVEYAIQIAKALEHAHAHGVVHRDLKPANLLITKQGLKLTDFGIARDTQSTALTAAGKTLGTMAYMAPEQISGKYPIGAKTDLYALGCVIFEMLTGRTVFVSETQPEMLFKHLDEEPPAIREFNINVPLWLDQLVSELLAKEPADRPYDALAVQVKLEEIKQKVAQNESIVKQTVQGGAGATMKEGDAELTRILGKSKRKKRKKREHVPLYERAWFLGLCLAGVMGLLVWGFWPKSEAEVFAEIQPIMASSTPEDWYEAEYRIKNYLAGFSEGEHRSQVEEWQGWIDMTRAERQAELRETRGRDPESPAERAYMEARQFERFGDRLTALQKYEAMPGLFTSEQDTVFVNLARRQSQKIREAIGGEDDPAVFIREQLQEADDLYLAGDEFQAESRWKSIVDLYKNLPEHDSVVRRARSRLIDPEGALKEELRDQAGRREARDAVDDVPDEQESEPSAPPRQ